ncbi:DUF3267 domain-containing protein [Paenisporosarcina indica]|uniref:DUF3267 domain-containing protein n=1 Tax=Paenisporosarcina indica TaxID=650093 RepID=UPI0009500AF1|nr:DUF3267 domain-containing protein [Paenisporosarcina indica]
MHCWKTINVKKQYGLDRIFMLSTLLVLAVFSLFYVVLKMLINHHLSDDRFALFLLSLILLYPIHKGLHFVPLIRYRHQVHFSIKKQIGFMPILSMRVKEPVSKNRFLLALLTPFLCINTMLIAGAFLLPAFGHYFTMLLAYHCGLCLIDLLYIKNLARSPKKALIEETETGYEILIPPTIM